MGMEHTVLFKGSPPTWSAVRDLLARRGFAVQMRMIDGQLAFPDEEPEEPWSELRVATAAGMVTLSRAGNQVKAVVWGNAEPALQQFWNALTWAFAEVGDGTVESPEGSLSAEMFRQHTRLDPR
jgi:hypothetical protein